MKTLQRIASAIWLVLLVLLFSTKSNAQVKAAFAANKNTVSCATESIYFSDSSKGNPTSWSWDFGDHATSTLASPSHQFPKPGRYTVSLIAKNGVQVDTATSIIVVLGPTVQYTKTIDTSCSTVSVKFSSKATGIGPLTYNWDFGDGKTSSALTTSITHYYKGASSYPVNLTARDTSGCSAKAGETLSFNCVAPVLSSTPATLTASRECVDQFGWTNYYADNNNTPSNMKDDILLLSVYKDGANIGSVGDGTFEVKVVATEKAGTSQAILLNSPVITNPTGYYVMNRYWAVKATTQPIKPLSVRFYFNDQDVNDINGSYPSHDADFSQLILYKTTNGNPDPTKGLTGASDIKSLFSGTDADESHWTYTFVGGGSHAAEFVVSDFTGGGGAGVTKNNETLPVKMISFAGQPDNNGIKLNWSVASEVNVERYDIEASVDGRTFTAIGNVAAKGNTTAKNDYTFSDVKLNAETAKYYKIVTVDKDGRKNYSEVIKISLAGLTNNISLYPVPANNYITVSSKSVINKTCVVEVYNSLGLKVMHVNKTAPGNSFQLNTSTLPAGRYRTIIYSNNDKIGDAAFIIAR